ncbi:MAG: dTMP kinase [bacterium]
MPFIVIEALDAGGSQTQTDVLVRRLRGRKYNVLQLHFPHEDRATGRLIYDKFLHLKNKYPFSKREQALLYIQDFFSRAEDIQNHLNKKTGRPVVVSDRFYTSTIAYQTAGLTGKNRQKMISWIKWLCLKGKPGLIKPDLVIFLDTPVEISLKHLANKKKDYHENKQKLTTFRTSYLRIAKEDGWVVISSVNDRGQQRSIEDIHHEIWRHIQPLLLPL